MSSITFKRSMILMVMFIILAIAYNIFIYNKTMNFIKNNNCVETDQIRYSSNTEGQISSKIKYKCNNGEYWFDDYSNFKSFKALFFDD